MFQPQTSNIAVLADQSPGVIGELDMLFGKHANMYIDYANVRPWSEKLGWHIDLKRLKQFLDSFNNIGEVKFYQGTLRDNEASAREIQLVKDLKYTVRTKPVKIMHHSINVSSLASSTDPSILKEFIRQTLLRKFNGETVEYLNMRLAELNHLGTLTLEDRKCNFDVEIGTDMLRDAERSTAETFILWSGDSDFTDTLQQLLSQKKAVILFATARRVARELNELRESGLIIFDIQKIRDFICWKRERTDHSKGENPKGPPKL